MCKLNRFECGCSDCINPMPYSVKELLQRRAACRRYYQRNKERILAQKADYYQRNRDKKLTYKAEYDRKKRKRVKGHAG